MQDKTINCKHCRRSFTPLHGNRKYCKEKPCEAEYIKIRGHLYTFHYGEIRSGLQNNEDLLITALGDEEFITLPLMSLVKNEFRFDCYFGRRRDQDNNIWYFVGPVAYTIIAKDNQQFIKIKKLTKDELYKLLQFDGGL